MREIVALVRANWLTEASYRMSMLFSIASLALIVVPLYFIAGALQPMMGATIASQSRQYFAFALVGATTYSFLAACTSALPSALASAIGRGTLEAFLGTPTRLPFLLIGMSGYAIGWAFLRATIAIVAGVILGARVAWAGMPLALIILLLLVLAYGAVGLVAAALVLRFRTTGPLISGVLSVSALLGGVYYPTHVIPSWLRTLSNALPLSYGLRAMRQAALLGSPFHLVGRDVEILAIYVAAMLPVGILCLALALRYARHSGSLSHY